MKVVMHKKITSSLGRFKFKMILLPVFNDAIYAKKMMSQIKKKTTLILLLKAISKNEQNLNRIIIEI